MSTVRNGSILSGPSYRPPNTGEVIRIDEIAALLGDVAIAKIAKRAGLPAGTDLKRLGAAVGGSARRYAEEAREATPNTIHRQIDALARAADRRDYGALAQAYGGLSDAARKLLEERSQRIQQRVTTNTERLAWKLPTPEDCLGLQRRDMAAGTMYSLAVTGGYWAKGRRRPGGKQSMAWRRRLHAPESSRSEPRKEAERNFLMWLRLDYALAAGRMPPNTTRLGMEGPFARFVAECLLLVRAPVTTGDHDREGLAVQLINGFGRELRLAKLSDDWRRILGPLRHVHPAIWDLARFMEKGMAEIGRVGLPPVWLTPS